MCCVCISADCLCLLVNVNRSELDEELECTGMVNSVSTDIQNMRKEYETALLPLILEHPDIFKYVSVYLCIYLLLVAQ